MLGWYLRQDERANAGGDAEPGGVERGRQEVGRVQQHARQGAARVLEPVQRQTSPLLVNWLLLPSIL